MEQARFRILGSIEAERNGASVKLGPPKQRAFLALLLVNVNRVVSRDQLVDELWPDEPPPTAVKGLQVFASRLRKELGEEAGLIVTRGQGYLLELDAERLDAARFERLLAEGQAALEAGRPDAARSALESALALWRGPALADVQAEAFACREAGRLEELRLLARELRVEAELVRGAHAAVVPELEQLVAEQPLRERPRGQLMRALYGSGRQAEALAAYQDAHRVLSEELGIEPSEELQSLQHAILNHEPSLTVEPESRSVTPTNLVESPTPLIGRQRELEQLAALLDRDGIRLVTITGPGGTGKTRLAVEVARTRVDRHSDGVFFVDLAAIEDDRLLTATVAQTLGLEPPPDEPVDRTLREHLDGKRMLLVLDNLEQLRGAGRILAGLLAACARVQILATGRSGLHVSAEHEFPLDPLELPARGATAAEAAAAGAVALFVERGQAVRPDFELDPENVPAVVGICRRLDGLPLALELAAARVKLLPPPALLRRLEESLGLLGNGARDLPERQRTLRATVDWSHALLEPDEQALFRRLGVFAGGSSLEAVEAVCADNGVDMLSLLGSLVDKSLIRSRPSRSGEPRFTMLETLRSYAVERLDASSEAEDVRRRHASYVEALLDRLGSLLAGPKHAEATRGMTEELENVRTAMTWTLRAGKSELALRIATGVARLAGYGMFLPDAREWLRAALEQSEEVSVELRSHALVRAGTFALLAGEPEEARLLIEESLALARADGDPEKVGSRLNILGVILVSLGLFDEALACHEEALAIARAAGDTYGEMSATMNLGNDALNRHDFDRAQELFEEALAICRGFESPDDVARIRTNLALVHTACGRIAEAEAHIRDVLPVFRELGNYDGLLYAVVILSAHAAAAGDDELAAVLAGAASAAAEANNFRFEPFEQGLHDRTVAQLRERLGAERAEALFAQGRELPFDEAVELAAGWHVPG